MTTPHPIRWLLAVISLCLIVGCRSEPTEPQFAVRGTVTLDGKPLNQVSVRFVPKDGERGAVTPVDQGSFSLGETSGPTAGNFDIVISPMELEFDQAMNAIAAGQRDPLGTSIVPERYLQPGQLTATVLPDSVNEFQFQLQSR